MAEEVKKEPTRRHKVLKNLRHNGKHYNQGATVELTAKQAEPLVQSNVVEPVVETAKSAK